MFVSRDLEHLSQLMEVPLKTWILHITMIWQMIATVALWWVANTITSIASKSVMIGEDVKDESSWMPAFKDLRWLELTALQHLVGAVASVVWLKAVVRTSLQPANTSKRAILMATLGNVTGNLATNAAYALISSSTTQVIKACEPLFTLVLSLVLYKTHNLLNLHTLLSIPIMIAGACSFALRDNSFNIWGLTAAITSNIAFPIRNIFLKKLITSNSWENSLQNYAAISLYSVFLLLPVLVVKLAITQVLFVLRLDDGIVSAVSHFTYNVASVTVLQHVSPLTHAILNLSKRVFVIVANIVYFHTPMSFSMSMGLLVFFFGLVLYHTAYAISTPQKSYASYAWTFLISISTITCLSIAAVSHTQLLVPKYNPSTECLSAQQTIYTAWVFERPIPNNIVTNIQDLSDQNPHVPIHVYCGTSQCVRAITELNNADITVEFLVVGNIVKDMPLEHWLARHPINKVLAGVEFENHLHEVVRLGILWNQGGIYVDPTVRVTGGFTCQDAWISTEQGDGMPGLLDASYFPKQHPFIGKLAKLFESEFPKMGTENATFHFDFQKTVWKAYFSSNNPYPIPDGRHFTIEKITTRNHKLETHFGTLSYDSKVQLHTAANLGDEIQGFPGLQFLPFVDFLIERDNLKQSAGTNRITVFFNAWWGYTSASWPPPDNIDPIMLSLHIKKSVQNIWAREKGYLEGKAPIGCRDYSTLDFLRKHNIDAFFSGCLTLLIKNPSVGRKRNNNIYLVDVKNQFTNLLPSEVQEKAIAVGHGIQGPKKYNGLARFTAAYQLMEMYASAKLVITQRIHCALPCVAMGTPVIFINSPGMPGGGGTGTKSSPRTDGLTPLFHTLDLYTKSMEDAKDWLQNFTWHNPPPNPNMGMTMRLKATAWSVIRQNQALYDAAHKFGLLPLSPPAPTTDDQLVFHLIFTTAKNTSITFSKLQWRCIESIFFHHPFANVIIHSNTLLQSDFNVLTEAGYTIEVQGYSLEDLLKDSPAQNFIEKLQKAKEGQYWYSHETDLLRLLILFKWGGVYMDTNVIIVRPVDSLKINVIAWQDALNKRANGAFMMFQKGNPFLKACLKEFADNYEGSRLGVNGPDLLTRIWRRSYQGSGDIHVLNHLTFYMFYQGDVKKQCFTDMSGHIFDSNMKNLKEKAYVVHLNAKITGSKGITAKLKEGTICKHLLNSYCVLCNKQY